MLYVTILQIWENIIVAPYVNMPDSHLYVAMLHFDIQMQDLEVRMLDGNLQMQDTKVRI